MSRNKNNNQKNNGPEVKPTVEMNLDNSSTGVKTEDAQQANSSAQLDAGTPVETAEQMEARIKAEMEAKHQMELREAKAEAKAEAQTVGLKTTISESDVDGMLAQMLAEKEKAVAEATKDKAKVVDDTYERMKNSEKISARQDYVGTLSKAKFMMAQNQRYAIENKPEPYSEEAIKNTLMKASGL